MGTDPGVLFVRRSIWIDAKPERVWEEFETLDAMREWFGTGHTLVQYEPRVGGWVETDPSAVHGEQLRFGPENHRGFEAGWGMLQLEALLARVDA